MRLSAGRREQVWAARIALVPLGIVSSALYEVSRCAGAHRLPHTKLQQKPRRVFPRGKHEEGEKMFCHGEKRSGQRRKAKIVFQAATHSQEGNLEVPGVWVTAGTGTGSCHAIAASHRGIHSTGGFSASATVGTQVGSRRWTMAHQSTSWWSSS